MLIFEGFFSYKITVIELKKLILKQNVLSLCQRRYKILRESYYIFSDESMGEVLCGFVDMVAILYMIPNENMPIYLDKCNDDIFNDYL